MITLCIRYIRYIFHDSLNFLISYHGCCWWIFCTCPFFNSVEYIDFFIEHFCQLSILCFYLDLYNNNKAGTFSTHRFCVRCCQSSKAGLHEVCWYELHCSVLMCIKIRRVYSESDHYIVIGCFGEFGQFVSCTQLQLEEWY